MAIEYGLTKFGFNKKNFPEIKEEIETSLQDSFGAVNLDDKSNFGQLVGIFTEREALLWEALESIYNSQYPDTASDFSLDGVSAYTGLTRLQATSTKVVCQLTGTNNTLITRDSQVGAETISAAFLLESDVTLSNTGFTDISLGINDAELAAYALILNNINIAYTNSGDDPIAILDGLATEINNNFITLEANVEGDALIIETIVDDVGLSQVFTSEGININSVTNNGSFVSNEEGRIVVPANSIDIIETPVSGWLSVNNRESGETGRDIETDVELRIRRNQSLRVSGSGTVEALRSRLLNLDGVITASIFENTSNDQVGNLPPHSFESLVQGGQDEDIGSVLWNYKPAGILTYGEIDVIVNDSTGQQQVVSFSRPTTLYVYVTVNITKDGTGDYPDNAESVIKEAIVQQFNQQNIGDDVIYQSLYKSVYLVDGIETATILIGGTLDELTIPTLSSSNITVASSQVAVTDVTKITINEV